MANCDMDFYNLSKGDVVGGLIVDINNGLVIGHVLLDECEELYDSIVEAGVDNTDCLEYANGTDRYVIIESENYVPMKDVNKYVNKDDETLISMGNLGRENGIRIVYPLLVVEVERIDGETGMTESEVKNFTH